MLHRIPSVFDSPGARIVYLDEDAVTAEVRVPQPLMVARGSGPILTLPIVLHERYELRRRIGAGGMGEVFLGVDRLLERDVAVKVMRGELAHKSYHVERFRREAQLLARVESARVIQVYDMHFGDDVCYIVMRHVAGSTLNRIVETTGPLDPTATLELASDVLDGLCALHAEGLVHRDVKPANVLIDLEQRGVLLDLGVALDRKRPGMTPTDMTAGTLAYMAPEQKLTGQVDGRSDVFQVGLLMLYAVFGVDASEHTIDNGLDDTLLLLPSGIADVIARALEREPDARFQTADEMKAAVARALCVSHDPEPIEIPLADVPDYDGDGDGDDDGHDGDGDGDRDATEHPPSDLARRSAAGFDIASAAQAAADAAWAAAMPSLALATAAAVEPATVREPLGRADSKAEKAEKAAKIDELLAKLELESDDSGNLIDVNTDVISDDISVDIAANDNGNSDVVDGDGVILLDKRRRRARAMPPPIPRPRLRVAAERSPAPALRTQRTELATECLGGPRMMATLHPPIHLTRPHRTRFAWLAAACAATAAAWLAFVAAPSPSSSAAAAAHLAPDLAPDLALAPTAADDVLVPTTTAADNGDVVREPTVSITAIDAVDTADISIDAENSAPRPSRLAATKKHFELAPRTELARVPENKSRPAMPPELSYVPAGLPAEDDALLRSATAYERDGEVRSAITALRQYLADVPDAANAVEVHAHLGALNAALP